MAPREQCNVHSPLPLLCCFPGGLSVAKTECWVEWWQGGPKEQPSLHTREQGRMQEQREHLRDEPTQDRAAASLRQENALGSELEAVQGAHVSLTELLDGG